MPFRLFLDLLPIRRSNVVQNSFMNLNLNSFALANQLYENFMIYKIVTTRTSHFLLRTAESLFFLMTSVRATPETGFLSSFGPKLRYWPAFSHSGNLAVTLGGGKIPSTFSLCSHFRMQSGMNIPEKVRPCPIRSWQ